MQQKRFTQIKGISEARRLPRLGKIRLGIRAATQKGRTKDCTHPEGTFCFRCSYPKEVSYFVLPEEARAVYGPEPTEIDIMFPVDDPSVIFPQAYKWYGADQGLKCKGDGETAIRRLADVADPRLKAYLGQAGQKDDDLVEVPCPCPMLDQGKCGPKGCLMVLLPRVTCGGVYQIDTGSVINLTEINSTLDFLQSLLGRIAMVPLKLRRVPQSITFTDPKTGKASTKVHYMLRLVFEGAMADVMRLRQDRMALSAGYEVPTPVDDGPEPTGECPVEVEGEVVDPRTGEVISGAKDEAGPEAPPQPGNGKDSGKDAPSNPLDSLKEALYQAEIEPEVFRLYLIAIGGLGERGRLGDLPSETVHKLLLPAAWPKRVASCREWMATKKGMVPPTEEPSQEKLEAAKSLLPGIAESDGGWLVPSSRDGHGPYMVRQGSEGWTCTCEGYVFRASKYECKHIWAAQLWVGAEAAARENED